MDLEKFSQLSLDDFSMTTNHCSYCGKTIKSKKSIERNMGPVCYSRSHVKEIKLKIVEEEKPFIDPMIRLMEIFG